MLSLPLLLLGLASSLNALPAPANQVISQRDTAWVWNQGATLDYTIHVSCNATERSQLQRALDEGVILAQHAKDHIMRFGNSSETFVKYFGNSSTTAEPAGWYDKLISGDREGVVFRCDDIDNLCYQDGWAGHWRGEIAPDQTVICPLSFESRWPLEAMCGHGYTVATGKDAQWFGADILHRLFHTHKVSEGVVDHYADTQETLIQLAKDHPEQAVRNSATLRHFAVEVYAYDIAVPGVGCSGVLPKSSEDAVPALTTTPAATTVSSAATECHTHADGVVHCA